MHTHTQPRSPNGMWLNEGEMCSSQSFLCSHSNDHISLSWAPNVCIVFWIFEEVDKKREFLFFFFGLKRDFFISAAICFFIRLFIHSSQRVALNQSQLNVIDKSFTSTRSVVSCHKDLNNDSYWELIMPTVRLKHITITICWNHCHELRCLLFFLLEMEIPSHFKWLIAKMISTNKHDDDDDVQSA